jgi:FlaA1/EpsC-like NDP-sugar epimerase
MNRPVDFDFSALFPERKTLFAKELHGLSVRRRRVLITGAGGSIGSAMTRELLRESPTRLLLIDHSEQALYDLRRRLGEGPQRGIVQYILGDVRDQRLIEETLSNEQPEIIFHTAAFKHVPLLEENPFAAVENNGLATWRLTQSAANSGVTKLLLISTDKAANPRSMLGVSKRLAEAAILGANTTNSQMSALRLGNVADSSGSVMPTFREQIARGGPVTVTHRDAARYFLTMNETCLAIGAVTNTETSAGLFVPEMGEPVSILRLAERMIDAARVQSGKRIEIQITGLRPGDKLTEELLARGESLRAETVPGIREVGGQNFSREWIESKFNEIVEIVSRRDLTALLDVLREVVPEYQPGATVTSSCAAAGAGVGNE